MLANAGVPMLAIELPVMVIALAPIVLLEAWIYVDMCQVEWHSAWRGTACANLLSTLIGVPVAWFFQVAVQTSLGGGHAWGLSDPALKLAAVTMQSAWLIPYESDLDWMIPAAALFLLLPAFAISVPCEALFLRRWFHGLEAKRIRSSVIRANLASYCLLAAFWGALLIYRISSRS
jgi:hypothetical protein